MVRSRVYISALIALAVFALPFFATACKSEQSHSGSIQAIEDAPEAPTEHAPDTPDAEELDPSSASDDSAEAEAETAEAEQEALEEASADSSPTPHSERQGDPEVEEGGLSASASSSNGCEDRAVLCGETCVDLTESNENCGKCGRRCFRRQDCDEGFCRGLGVVSVAELQQHLNDKDFLLINVRVPASGVIPGTDASIAHDRLEELKAAIGDDLDRRIVLYCGTTGRVQTPLRTLVESGYRSVTYLDGGIMAWQMAGLPIVPN